MTTRRCSRVARQGTIGRVMSLDGRGLHTGRRVSVTLAPAAPDTGIVFHHCGFSSMPTRIPALWTHLVERPLCTALSLGGKGALLTVEHCLAALAAFGIDNAIITVVGDELPIFDGGATPWCRALADAERADQPRARRYLKVVRTVELQREHRLLRVEPAEAFSLDVSIALASFGLMRWTGEITAARFAAELAPARSFGRLTWAVPLKLRNLFSGRPVLQGANLQTTAVLWGGRIIGGMRVPDEPVRHRALDLVGDLALSGLPWLGHVTAEHTGHQLNHALVAKVMSDPANFEIVEATST